MYILEIRKFDPNTHKIDFLGYMKIIFTDKIKALDYCDFYYNSSIKYLRDDYPFNWNDNIKSKIQCIIKPYKKQELNIPCFKDKDYWFKILN